MRIFRMNKPEWGFIILGCFASLISGGVQPAFAIVFSKVLAVFSLCTREEQEEQITLYVWLFVAFGFITLASNFLQVYFDIWSNTQEYYYQILIAKIDI